MAVVLVGCIVFLVVCIVVYRKLTKPGRAVPSITDFHKDKLTIPATVLAKKICNRELTAEEVMVAYVERIKIVNVFINAIVQERFDLALGEARQLDKQLENMTTEEREKLVGSKVLLGVPFTNKECFAVKGMPQTAGMVSRQNQLAGDNALVVQRLLDAGAILIGLSNVSELCMWWETSNHVYGRTKNPYNSEHFVGGSSGGEGAIIGAAGSVLGTGSDIGGSIRMPAFFNGIFGHKPSPGIVPNDGQYPNASIGGQHLLCTGPMCRYATDLRTVLKVMSGDSLISQKLETKVDISKLQFYTIGDNKAKFVSSVSPELIGVQKKVIKFLERKYNVSVKELKLVRLKYSLDIWSMVMSKAGGPTFCELLGGFSNKAVNPVWELIKWCAGMSQHTLPAIGLGLVENFSNLLPHSHQENVMRSGTKLRQELETILGENGVLLYPPHPTPALRHNVSLVKPFNFIYTAIFNVLHMPVTQCPLGLGSDGLPLGIQVVASRNNDHLTLAVAEVLEEEFGGWVPQ